MLARAGERQDETSVNRSGCRAHCQRRGWRPLPCSRRRRNSAPDVLPYVHVPAGRIAITHLRIIDGTGAAPIEDATLLIDGAKIGAVLPAGSRRSGRLSNARRNRRDRAARPRRHARPHVLHRPAEPRRGGQFRAAAGRPADDLQRAAALPRQRRHDDAHHRQRRALRRPQREARDRRRAADRAAHGRHRPLSRRAGQPRSSRCTS